MATTKTLLQASSLLVCFAFASCGDQLTNGAVGLSSLTRVNPEGAGMNCPNGGQAVQLGVDDNRNGVLDDGEVDQVSYVCNVPANDVGIEIQTIETGDSRCTAGGSEVHVGKSDGQGGLMTGFKSYVSCNGALGVQGAKGDTGVAGAQGDKGDTGAAGTQGAKGDKGDTGAQGSQGMTGAQGSQGAQGAKGDKGDTGSQGMTGAQGSQGAQGAKGDKGDTGSQGMTGAQGDKGDKGDTGSQGVMGDKGDKGDTGAQGAMGDKGDKGDTGSQGVMGAMGDKGDKGDKGDTGAQGAAGPAGTGPALGRFLPSQIVAGAVLTCASVSTSATNSSCSGPKLNGLDIRLAGIEAQAICNRVTGAGFAVASGMGAAANPYAIWTGTTWTLSEVGATPMLNLNCNR